MGNSTMRIDPYSTFSAPEAALLLNKYTRSPQQLAGKTGCIYQKSGCSREKRALYQRLKREMLSSYQLTNEINIERTIKIEKPAMMY